MLAACFDCFARPHAEVAFGDVNDVTWTSPERVWLVNEADFVERRHAEIIEFRPPETKEFILMFYDTRQASF